MLDRNTPPRPADIDVIPVASHPTKGTKFINYIIVSFLVIIGLSIGIFLSWSFADENILEVKNSPFPVRVIDDPTGQTGGIAFLKVDYCKHADITGEVRMSYVSKSREVFLPLMKERYQTGCYYEEIPVIIPLNLLADEYKIKFRVTHDKNPIKKDVTVNFESQPISVGTRKP